MITLDDTSFHLQSPDWPHRACVRVEAGTLRDALAAAEGYYGVTLRPHDEGKWFRVLYPADHPYHERYAKRRVDAEWFRALYPPDDPYLEHFAKRRVDAEFELVDVHIERNEKMICPGQNLDFVLLHRDTVHFLQLIC